MNKNIIKFPEVERIEMVNYVDVTTMKTIEVRSGDVFVTNFLEPREVGVCVEFNGRLVVCDFDAKDRNKCNYMYVDSFHTSSIKNIMAIFRPTGPESLRFALIPEELNNQKNFTLLCGRDYYEKG